MVVDIGVGIFNQARGKVLVAHMIAAAQHQGQLATAMVMGGD